MGLGIPDPRPYAQYHHLHRNDERYLGLIEPFTREIEPGTQRKGDIVLWKYGRVFSHAAIVDEWPFVIHAYAAENSVVRSDMRVASPLTDEKHPMRFFTPW